MKYILIVLGLMNFAFAAKDLSVTPYVKVQEALAKDDFKAALEGHKALCDKELGDFKKEYKDCGKKFATIDELRESFKSLSEIYIKYGNKAEMKNFTTANCPMAKGKWIQKNGSLANPYYGKSMLECGEKI